MISCATEQRLTNVTPDDIKGTLMESIRQMLKAAGREKQLAEIARKSGISRAELNLIMRDVSIDIRLYTATQILGALGKRLVIVDE